MEWDVKNVDVPNARTSSFGAVHEPTEEPNIKYTPGDFLREAGYIIAISLGLGLLAHILLVVPGQY